MENIESSVQWFFLHWYSCNLDTANCCLIEIIRKYPAGVELWTTDNYARVEEIEVPIWTSWRGTSKLENFHKYLKVRKNVWSVTFWPRYFPTCLFGLPFARSCVLMSSAWKQMKISSWKSGCLSRELGLLF